MTCETFLDYKKVFDQIWLMIFLDFTDRKSSYMSRERN